MADETDKDESADRPRSDAGETNGQTTDRRRAGSWLDATRNVISNSLRYVVIAALFLYLLTAVLLFQNIMAFHDRVASEVGDDSRARRVVLMVNKIHENPDAYPPGEQQLPIGALAVTLGKLQSTYTDLTRFRDFAIETNDAEAVPVMTNGTGARDVDETLREEFDALRKTLNLDVEGLHDYVVDNAEDAAILMAVDDLRDNRECMGGDADVFDRIVCLEDKFAQFRTSIARTLDGFVAYEAFCRAMGMLSELDLESLQPNEFTGSMNQLAVLIRQIARGSAFDPEMDTERQRLNAYVQQLEQWTEPPVNGEAISALTSDFDDMTTDVIAIGHELPVDPLTPKIHDAMAAMNERFAAFKEKPRELLPAFDEELNNITTKLRDRYQEDFEVAKTIVEEIGKLRTEMPILQSIVPATYQAADGHITENDDAKQFYEKRLETIDGYMKEMEKKLEKQGRTIALANVISEDENESELSAKMKADGILQDFDALDRFGALLMPLSTLVPKRMAISQFGLNPQRLATLTTDSITMIYVLLIGAIGSMLYINKYQLKLVLDGHWLTMPPQRPLPWFLFRPIFGVVVALVLYFLIRAGQVALGSGQDGEVGTTLNIWFLSALALFAGILSWDALRMIETRGQSWFRSQVREPLWATGVGNALRMSNISEAECAERIGRSEEQVNRWLAFEDKVSVEMQDRIRLWLDMRQDELFGEDKPSQGISGQPLWAVGLREAMDGMKTRLDAEGLVLMLREEKRDDNVQRTKDWIALKKQVPPATQWRLVDLLRVPHHRLFSDDIGHLSVWGTGLRHVIEDKGKRAQDVAGHFDLPVETVHDWKELTTPVPHAMHERLMKHFECTFGQLFEPGDLSHHGDMYQKANDLKHALEKKGIETDRFARDVDVELKRVESWIEREGKGIAKPTRERILQIFGGDNPDLFQPRQLTDQRNDQTGD